MSAKQVTIDPEAWARNLRVDPDAPPPTDEAMRRWVNNYFAFWAVCTLPACKRTRRCAGEPLACHARLWPFVPERHKFEFRACLKASREGLSLEQTQRKVKADAEQWAEQIAQAEAAQLAEIRRMEESSGERRSVPLSLAGRG